LDFIDLIMTKLDIGTCHLLWCYDYCRCLDSSVIAHQAFA